MLQAPSNPPIGNVELLHHIVKGESISGIAKHYQSMGWPVKDWEPIWRLNTEIYHNLRDRANPDMICPGDVLIIPRSLFGYGTLLHKLSRLRNEVEHDHSGADDLSRIQQDAENYSRFINTIGTVLSLEVGLAFKAIMLAALAEESMVATGEVLGRIAKEKRSLVIDIVRSMVSDAVGVTLDYGHSSPPVGRAWKASTKTVPGAMAIVRGHVKGVQAVLDVTELVLDWVEPTWITKWYLTNYGKAMDEAVKHDADTRKWMLNKLMVTIGRYKKEKAIVYAW